MESKYFDETINTKVDGTSTILEEQLNIAENNAKEWQNKYMYLAAEFDTFKRNMNKKLNDANKFKHKEIIIKLLDVVDNCERSFAYDDTYQPIHNQLLKILFDDGLEHIDVHIGDKFDDKTMNAISVTPNDGTMPPNCVSVIAKNGYYYKGEIIRYADVMVTSY